mmetsp:Transcript_12236/g.17942  ORF Transcript_12236/g.17942 Transcript_12236/m.17942 type:complete len:208 (-) Transcript_12236:226-849(-)
MTMMKATFILASLALVATRTAAQDDTGSFVRARDLSGPPCFSCAEAGIYDCNICSTSWLKAKYAGTTLLKVCEGLTSTDATHCITCDGMNETECAELLLFYQREILDAKENPDRSGIPGACEPDQGGTSDCDFGEYDSGVIGECISGRPEAGWRHNTGGCCVKHRGSCVCASQPDTPALEAIVDAEYGGDDDLYCHKLPLALPKIGG